MISVLYVDDEESLLELGKHYLEESADFQVDLLDSADMALELLKQKKYDAIISDFQMPEMDGLEFLRRVRRDYGQVPFILFTGRGREEVVIRALNDGVDFYLQKGGAPRPQFAELAHKIRLAVKRRQADLALEESERRYRDVVETQTEFISRFLPDGTHVFVNEAYCRYFGKTREEVIGHAFVPKIPKDDEKKIRRHLARLDPDHPSADIEHRVIMPDGTIKWQWWSDHAIFDDAGRIVEYQSIGKDITDKKEAEEALKKSENLYRTIFNTTGAATIIIGKDTTIQLANSGFARLSGFSLDELEGKKSWTDFVVTEDLGQMKKYHLDRRKDPADAPKVYEFRFVDRNGTIKNCINNVAVIPGTNQSVASVVDITERIAAEDNLRLAYEHLTAAEEELRAQFDELKYSQDKIRESERNYRSIIENLEDAFYRTDKNGNLVIVSPSFARELGYGSADEILGKNVGTDIYYHPEDRADFIEKIALTGEIKKYKVVLRKKNGKPLSVSVNSHIYYDEMGKTAGVEGMLHIMDETCIPV